MNDCCRETYKDLIKTNQEQAEYTRKIREKYLRIRKAVRNCEVTIRERRLLGKSQRYAELLRICEQLTFAAGQLVKQTDDFTWFRMTKKDYEDFVQWRRERVK